MVAEELGEQGDRPMVRFLVALFLVKVGESLVRLAIDITGDGFVEIELRHRP